MSKPKTKDELLAASAHNFAKLNDLIDSLSREEQMATFPKGPLNRNIRDVIAHLYHWHKMMLQWYKVGMRGEKSAMPSEEYSWRQTPQLNIHINKTYTSLPLSEARHRLDKSHKKVMNLIESHSNEELFTKKLFKWTGSTSIAAYFIANTSSHYDWAYKLIKKNLK